jgi:WD40 repeat protein
MAVTLGVTLVAVALLIPGFQPRMPQEVHGHWLTAQRRGADVPPSTGPTARLGSRFFRHGGLVRFVGCSRDGKIVATVSADRTARVWDAATGRERARQTFPGRVWDPTLCGALSPDGRVFAVGVDTDVWLWKWASKDRDRFRTKQKPAALAFSPDGGVLAWVEHDHTIHAREIATGKELLSGRGITTALAFAPTGRTLAYPELDGEKGLTLLDLRGKPKVRQLFSHPRTLEQLAFSPDGRTLASTSRDSGTLRLWDVVTGKELRRLRGHNYGAVLLTPDGKSLIAGDMYGVIRLWSFPEGKLLRRLQGQQGGVIALACSPDGRWLFSAGVGEAVRRWDLRSGRETTPEGHRYRVGAVGVRPEDGSIVSVDLGGEIRIWQVKAGKAISTFPGPSYELMSVALSNDCSLVALGGVKGELELRDAKSGTTTFILKGHEGRLGPLGFSANGRTLASCAVDGFLRLWDVTTGKEVSRYRVPQGIEALAVTPDGGQVAFAQDSRVTLWEPATGKVSVLHDVKNVKVRAIAYSPDGRMIVLAGHDFRPRVWVYDLATGLPIARITPVFGDKAPSSVRFIGPGKVACGTEGGMVLFLDLAREELIEKRQGDCGSVLALAPTRGDKLVAAGNADTTVMLWKVPPAFQPGPGPGVDVYVDPLWKELKLQDAHKAHAAVLFLVSYPASAVSMFREKLQALSPVPPETIAAHIVALSSRTFRARQRACEELKRIGDEAEPALRRRLQQGPGLDERRLIEGLLRTAAEWSPEQLRRRRSVQTLEYIGTAEARALVEKLANTWPESRLTREARATLERMQKK